MSDAADPGPAAQPAVDGDDAMPPRADWHDAIGWTALGVALLIGSLTMDRLEQQHINPYTVPGLLPGLLGVVMILLGLVLGLRSWDRGAFTQQRQPPSPDLRDERRRVWVVIGLCVGYGVVLIGHGIPFWLASSVYVAASILILQRMSRDPDERQMTARVIVNALVIAVASSVVTQLVFQELFLVRMH